MKSLKYMLNLNSFKCSSKEDHQRKTINSSTLKVLLESEALIININKNMLKPKSPIQNSSN